MKPADPPSNVTEVLHLHSEGLSVRWIARSLHLSRRTVRTLLDQHGVPVKLPAPRGSFLDSYQKALRTFLADTPERRVQVEST
jgi:orotate phosphoribosyltransferase-like protein